MMGNNTKKQQSRRLCRLHESFLSFLLLRIYTSVPITIISWLPWKAANRQQLRVEVQHRLVATRSLTDRQKERERDLLFSILEQQATRTIEALKKETTRYSQRRRCTRRWLE